MNMHEFLDTDTFRFNKIHVPNDEQNCLCMKIGIEHCEDNSNKER